jgi:uncharacterized circularly permuted ATP-grasp superfamily protein
MSINWEAFEKQDFFDELITPKGNARGYARKLIAYLRKLDEGELEARQLGAELAIKQMGITFRVYTEEEGSIDRAWPFDIVPRLIQKKEWDRIEEGLMQRVQALNLFIDDIYHKQRIIKDKVFPAAILAESVNFREQCVGIDPPLGMGPHLRQRPGARPRRHHVCAGRQPAGSLRRLLYAGEPPGDQAGFPRAVRDLQPAAGG